MKGTKEQELARYTAELAKPKAGVSEAGVSAPATAGIGDCRKAAIDLLRITIDDCAHRRDCLLYNYLRGFKSKHNQELIRRYQTQIDACLWLVTCADLVEADEVMRKRSALRSEYKQAMSEVLGTR